MINYALELDHNAFVSMDSNSLYNFGTKDFTLESWVNSTSSGTIISRKSSDGGPGNGGFLLVIKPDGSLKFATDNGFGFYEIDSSPTSILDGSWHHVVAVRKGGVLNIYLDGVLLEGTIQKNLDTPLDVNNSMRLVIGATDQMQEPNNHFSGLLTEIRVWNYAREINDILNYMNIKLSGDEDGLVGYLTFDFGLVIDYSKTRNKAQVNGNVMFTTKSPIAISQESKYPMTFLFSGAYDTATKYGGEQGQWNICSPLYLTNTGTVIFNNAVVNKPIIKGNTISWSASDNQTAAQFTFKLDSSEHYFWPEGNMDSNLFEGWIQWPGGGALDFRGKIFERVSSCSVVQNAMNGMIIDSGNGEAGTVLVVKEMTPDTHKHFCFTEKGVILHEVSQLAVTVKDNVVSEGTQIILSQYQEGNQGQIWSLGTNGYIQSALDNNMVLGISGNNDGSELVLKVKVDNDYSQLWYSLSGSQFIYNGGCDLVLDIFGANPSSGTSVIGYTKKTTGTFNQRWYFANNYIVSFMNGMVLSIKDRQANQGVEVIMEPMIPNAPWQQWILNGQQIISKAGNFVLDLADASAGSRVILAEPDASKATQEWGLLKTDDHQNRMLNRSVEEVNLAANTTTRFIIKIHTSDEWFAGTDDLVEISLKGTSKSTALIKLERSETHSNPFERGQTDQFTIEVEDVGELQSVFFRYGENTWFGGEKWVMDWVSVYDPARMMYYSVSYKKQMAYKTTLKFTRKVRNGSSDKIAASMYPAEGYGGWIDHTWVTIDDSEKGRTYFDCAGGHEGSPTTSDIVVTYGSLNDAIRMATSYNLSPQHPWKQVYGHDDVVGNETCGIRASGFRRWDGQCHQITNRLLHVGVPPRSLDDASVKPAAYGLSCLLWGPYGIGFNDWCRQNGFEPPLSNPDDAIFNYIRMFVTDTKKAHRAYYYATELQNQWDSDPDDCSKRQPQGEFVKSFIQSLHKDGHSNTTISKLVCLPEDKVEHDELETV
ncbi:ricin-type beta-trefoil lectin protein [Aneurinibacillus soli]|uniref:Ricin-type beta-trefoil lectin domain protein n=1 Tax=Aneurinibacillus soli TaxID=1500254 RepID=A0A0U5AVI3_9BACL|nr:LamG-like jellyroll fold domain-containing protein [Aneurinibacillus soli]PYE61410.1 ricin-type beta-trefoil lectin protein [Aneurinibacillus soli]BAU27761.1 Ricin-type beta-trefoil lectin domain protein [Aneurinibacillus soli]